jgi:D-lactate dehydrogenase (cytochrome)
MQPRRPSPETILAICADLRNQLGSRFVDGEAIRRQHANTLSLVPNQPPDAVVFPKTVGEVADIVRLCGRHRVPVIPFGTGSSFEGHVNAPYGGVSIDTSLMDAILSVNADDLDCVVEPGVTREALNASLRDKGLFFPIDPGANASLGGMASTRASGTNAVRYGTMRDNVLSLTVVLPNGEIARTGGRARKSSAGYDLTRLIIGSEGTLGVITEIALRLHGIPEAISAGCCSFPAIAAACQCAILTIQSGIPIARVELLDEVQVKACNAYSRLTLPELPMLFVEFHGSAAGVVEQCANFGAIAAELGGGQFNWATKAEDRTRLWKARHDAYWAASALRANAKGIPTDVCVPISRLAQCVEETKADIVATGLVAPIVGHVGDGNFHVLPLIDVGDAAEVARAQAFVDRVVERALAMGGTATGEHGIGQANMKYMPLEYGTAALDMMKAVKRALDPHNIMNPGKVVAW